MTGKLRQHVGVGKRIRRRQKIVQILRAAEKKRHRQRDRQALAALTLERPAKPACLVVIRDRPAAFHQILALEMRPAGIGDRGGVEDGRPALVPQRLECLQFGMQREIAGDLHRAADIDIRAHFHQRVVADEGRGGKTVHAATQHHHDKIGLAPGRGKRRHRQRRGDDE